MSRHRSPFERLTSTEQVERLFGAARRRLLAEEEKAVAIPELVGLNHRQARYAMARVWGGCSNAQAASFAGYRSDTIEGLKAIGSQLNRHPGIVAAMVALHRLIALRDADVTDPTETTTGPMIVAVEETDDLPGTEQE